jgi:hypothetical protein
MERGGLVAASLFFEDDTGLRPQTEVCVTRLESGRYFSDATSPGYFSQKRTTAE